MMYMPNGIVMYIYSGLVLSLLKRREMLPRMNLKDRRLVKAQPQKDKCYMILLSEVLRIVQIHRIKK